VPQAEGLQLRPGDHLLPGQPDGQPRDRTEHRDRDVQGRGTGESSRAELSGDVLCCAVILYIYPHTHLYTTALLVATVDPSIRISSDVLFIRCISLPILQPVCENFAFSIFMRAEEEDRSGTITGGTAKQFYAAALMFEVCEQFGDLDEEVCVVPTVAGTHLTVSLLSLYIVSVMALSISISYICITD
jgi:hypothetical protein